LWDPSALWRELTGCVHTPDCLMIEMSRSFDRRGWERWWERPGIGNVAKAKPSPPAGEREVPYVRARFLAAEGDKLGNM